MTTADPEVINWLAQGRRNLARKKELDGGHIIMEGSGFFGKCADCGQVVKLNRFLFGSRHRCLFEAR